jgi:hypothetical protein
LGSLLKGNWARKLLALVLETDFAQSCGASVGKIWQQQVPSFFIA